MDVSPVLRRLREQRRPRCTNGHPMSRFEATVGGVVQRRCACGTAHRVRACYECGAQSAEPSLTMRCVALMGVRALPL